MKRLMVKVLLLLGGPLMFGAACTAAQKTKTEAAAACTAADADRVIAILAGPGNGATKLLELATQVEPDIAACLLRAAKAPAPAATK